MHFAGNAAKRLITTLGTDALIAGGGVALIATAVYVVRDRRSGLRPSATNASVSDSV